jgi:hypothetical protein
VILLIHRFQALLSARAFHPRGALFTAHVSLAHTDEVIAGAAPTLTALGGPGEHRALVRVSKAVGTADSWPDLLGLAVRLPLPGGPVDLLFTTVGRHRLTGAMFGVATGWCTRPYSTVLPYRADGVLVRLGLDPQEPDRARGTDPQVVRDAVRERPLAFRLTQVRRGTGARRSGGCCSTCPCPTAPPTTPRAATSRSALTRWSTPTHGYGRFDRWPASERWRTSGRAAGGAPRTSPRPQFPLPRHLPEPSQGPPRAGGLLSSGRPPGCAGDTALERRATPCDPRAQAATAQRGMGCL